LNTVCIVFHNIDPVTRPHAVEVVKEFIKSELPPEHTSASSISTRS